VILSAEAMGLVVRENMTTEELVNMDPQTFGAAVAGLDAASCERHARDLFHRLGGSGLFEDYLTAVTRAAVLYHGAPEEQFAEIFLVAKSHFPGLPPGYDVFARLVGLTMRVICDSLPPVGKADTRKRSTDRRPGGRP
jgi:hypothetical protein